MSDVERRLRDLRDATRNRVAPSEDLLARLEEELLLDEVGRVKDQDNSLPRARWIAVMHNGWKSPPLLVALVASILVALFVAAIAVPTRPSTEVVAGPDPSAVRNGRIAVLRKADVAQSSGTIYLMEPDGARSTAVRAVSQGGELRWSPDGRTLAFGAGDPERDIYVMTANGQDVKRLTSEEGARHSSPAWSSDSKRLAYVKHTLEGGAASDGVWVTKVDGTVRRLVHKGDWSQPQWSPDNTRLLIAGRAGIHIVSVDSGTSVVVSDGGEATWSPDGTRIAYRDRTGLWILSLSSMDKSLVTADGRDQTWSPDGTKLAFVTGGESESTIAIVRGDGSSFRKIRIPPSEAAGSLDRLFQWSPDGKEILYMRGVTGSRCSIWRLDADGERHTQVTRDDQCDATAAWQPVPPGG